MKNLTFVFILFLSVSTFAQEHTEVIKKELQFDTQSDDNLLIVNNVNGNITVEGYSGSTILIEVEKMIRGKDQRRLTQGKEEVQVGIHEEGNDILVYMKTLPTLIQKIKVKNKSKKNSASLRFYVQEIEMNAEALRRRVFFYIFE